MCIFIESLGIEPRRVFLCFIVVDFGECSQRFLLRIESALCRPEEFLWVIVSMDQTYSIGAFLGVFVLHQVEVAVTNSLLSQDFAHVEVCVAHATYMCRTSAQGMP